MEEFKRIPGMACQIAVSRVGHSCTVVVVINKSERVGTHGWFLNLLPPMCLLVPEVRWDPCDPSVP
jgi:hypothetical protein